MADDEDDKMTEADYFDDGADEDAAAGDTTTTPVGGGQETTTTAEFRASYDDVDQSPVQPPPSDNNNNNQGAGGEPYRPLSDDDEDYPIPDFTAIMKVDDAAGGDLVAGGGVDITATPNNNNGLLEAMTDVYGNAITPSTSISDHLASISSTLYDELTNGNGNSTMLDGSGRLGGSKWWTMGWTWQKILLVTLISLCALGLLLGFLYLILGKKMRKTKGGGAGAGTAAGGSTTAAGTKTRYQEVPNA